MTDIQKLHIAKTLINEVFMALPVDAEIADEVDLNEAESLVSRVMLKMQVKHDERMVKHGGS